MHDENNEVLLKLRERLGGVTNLYAVYDRQETITFIVAAQDAQDACRLIREETGMENWTVGTTHTRRVLRNVDCQPEVLTAVGMQGQTKFRRIVGRSKEAANRRRERKMVKHKSDCALHNMPTKKPELCDCGTHEGK